MTFIAPAWAVQPQPRSAASATGAEDAEDADAASGRRGATAGGAEGAAAGGAPVAIGGEEMAGSINPPATSNCQLHQENVTGHYQDCRVKA